VDNDPFARLTELTRRLARTGLLEDAEKMQRETQAAQAAMAEQLSATGTATDPTGLVEATVRVDGTVEGVHVTAYAIRDLDHEQLEKACADAIRAARAAAATGAGTWLAKPGEQGDAR
jgi:DNA-binding protein YbaB